MAEVVVVGAGVGGLACAARLAAGGHRVTVLERSTVVGGKLGRREVVRPEGTYRFDTGPSLLTLPQVFDELFGAIGGAPPAMVPLNPVVRHVFPDGAVLDSCADPVEFTDRIAADRRAARPGRRARLATAVAAGRPGVGRVVARRAAPPGRLAGGAGRPGVAVGRPDGGGAGHDAARPGPAAAAGPAAADAA
ncbi:hypothetical protein GCM10009687_23450 [Asanoa iriomotensis]